MVTLDERTEISIPYLGAIDETERIISSIAIDILILADLDYERQRILQLANACEREMVEFKVVPSYFQILVSGLHLETISGIPVLGAGRLPLDRIVSRAIKRAIDIVGGTVGLLLSLPIISIFGTMVYRDSRVRFSIGNDDPEETASPLISLRSAVCGLMRSATVKLVGPSRRIRGGCASERLCANGTSMKCHSSGMFLREK